MTDPGQEAENRIPEAVAAAGRRFPFQLVWIIPIIAALIGGIVAVKSLMARGERISISFKSGEGIEQGKTKIKYKEVEVGEVKKVVIAKDRSHVDVTAEIDRDATPFLVDDSRFWVVRPRITGSNVSGLGTLLGGSYIGLDVGKSRTRKNVFQGLEAPPS